MYEILQKYIDHHAELGYMFASEFLNELIRNKIKDILETEDLD